MPCNVGQYLPPGECPDCQIEYVLHSGLEVLAPQPEGHGRRRRRKSFAPGNRIEYPVVSAEGHLLKLIAYSKNGELYAELHWGDAKIRALHTHIGHRNPGHGCPMADGHMHFPTSNYPLIGSRSTYAYEQDCDDFQDLNAFVIAFCALLNIEWDALQLVLGHGGRRI